jgi:hypothetical protein
LQDQTSEKASVIWAEWKSYFRPPSGHPLEGEHAIREVVLAALIPAYKAKAAGTKAAKVLLDAIGDAIHVEAFRQYTVEDLEDEMEVSLPPASFTRPNTPQYHHEKLHTLPYLAGMITLPPRTILANRDTQRILSKATLGNGALLCHPALATPPALSRA